MIGEVASRVYPLFFVMGKVASSIYPLFFVIGEVASRFYPLFFVIGEVASLFYPLFFCDWGSGISCLHWRITFLLFEMGVYGIRSISTQQRIDR